MRFYAWELWAGQRGAAGPDVVYDGLFISVTDGRVQKDHCIVL